MTKKDQVPVAGNTADVNRFLAKVASTPPVKTGSGAGRLIFAMDATASREPTWDRACHLHADMFTATESLGGLSVQLCYYRGFREFHRSPWCPAASDLLAEMTRVRCLGGHTQILRVLRHAREEARNQKVQAVVFVGDAMEENPDALCEEAGQLGLLNIPVFMFQEGHHPRVKSVFQQIATLSGGAWAPFDLSSASQLKALMSAVAVYAAGGRKALSNLSERDADATRLLEQLKR